MKKRILALALCGVMVAGLAACSSSSDSSSSDTTDGSAAAESASTTDDSSSSSSSSDFDTSMMISIFTREDGSGTRSAFVELFGIEQEDENGEKVDMTTEDANVTNNTSVMMTSVAGDEYAIGYISLGSLDATVKAVKIDGVEPSVETVKDGSYTIARPFNIATNGELSDVAQDFYNFIMSAEGQAVIEENGYIPIDDAAESFTSNGATGKVTVAGSSSVSPVMEKLQEAYLAINTGAEIEIQTSDSTTGMSSAAEGICDIGMASRELKDSEVESGLVSTTIAMDGIAVIVNNDSPLEELTSEQVMNIYTGEYYFWSDIME